MRDSRVRASRVALLVAVLAATIAGCGYSVRPPYDDRVKTVYVPVFRSVTFRRDVNFQLTELVIKEIENRTPFKVVGKPENADTTLEGVVNFTDKNLIVENPFNLPRQLTATMTVAVTWTDNRTEKKVTDPVIVTELYNFFPELGETSSAAFLRVNEKLARQIVGMMEKKW
jgi:hypothetical protein